MSARRIELDIEELVLYGFAPEVAPGIGEGMRRELLRLLVADGLPGVRGAGHEVARIDGGALHIPMGAPPAAVGRAVARALHGKVGR